MSVAKVTEISSTSTKSFEDAIQQGLARAGKTIRGIRSAWIKEQQVAVDDGRITGYRVNMLVTFILEDAPRGRAAKSAMGAAAPATKAPAKKAAKKAATKKSARKTARKRGGRR